MPIKNIIQEKIDIKQRKILASLFDSNGQRYSELSKTYEPEDRFFYHIDHLLSKGLINKRNGKYYITPDGVIKCSYLDFKTFEELHMKKTTMNFICRYKDKYLVIQKKEEGTGIKYLLPGDRAIFGEPLTEQVKKVLASKYGITGEIKYKCTVNFIQQSESGKIFFDDIVLIFNVELKEPEGRSKGKWLTREEIAKCDSIHPLIYEFIIKENNKPFLEIAVKENFNFEIEDE